MNRADRSSAGQATVETIAVVPLVVVVALGAAQALAARSAASLAGGAAEAGAVALLQDRDPESTAKGALGKKLPRGATVRVDGRRVVVRMPPRRVLPGLADLLTASATADAGPERAP